MPETTCPQCRGTNGEHKMDCTQRYIDRREAEAREIEASLDREDAFYRKHPRTDATS